MTTTTTTRTRTEAKKLMWEYYSENKSSLPNWIGEFREEILESIMGGESASSGCWIIVRNVEQITHAG